ncbi:MAG TPA: formyltransferase family protein [Thermoanaerobaculia bacterium]
MRDYEFRPTRIAVLTSFSAPGITDLLASSSRGTAFEIAGVISSETSLQAQDVIEAAGVPVVMHPIRRFHSDNRLPLRNLHARVEYDYKTAEILQGLKAEYVIAAGYRFIMTAPLLSEFPRRIIAIQDADLTGVDVHGGRPHAGLDAVRDAILGGAESTRSTAYFVTEDVGRGPLFMVSARYPVAPLAREALARGAYQELDTYAALHRWWMRVSAFGEMMPRIAEIVAAGTMQIVGDVVWIDGVPGPCRMGEAASICADRQAPLGPGVPESCPYIKR